MKLSLNWVNEFVDIQDYLSRPQELGDRLTRAGLEVEGIQNQRQQYERVVVGFIIEKGTHPSADRLSLCSVDIGSGAPLSIVCGAQNHKTGDKVIVAQVGAILPGDFRIQKSKIRGVDSSGMLCSLDELGLPGKSEGIVILPSEAPVGMALSDYMNLNDVLLELKVTPNRADCLSHYGLARELSLLLGRTLKPFSFGFSASKESVEKKLDVEIQESGHCLQYAARVMDQVQVGETPPWMKTRLEQAGFKSINSLVDVTNYVMLELGQPLHAFDYSQIKLNHIRVRCAKAKEKFESLDGTLIEMGGDELVISDQEKILALAGVVGGKTSGVQSGTKTIVLESASFAPQAIRKSARKNGIQTESSYRFSRGVDPSMVLKALDRASELIQKMNPSCLTHAKPIERGSQIPARVAVTLDLKFLSQKLGYEAEARVLENYLTNMGCSFKNIENIYHITPPPFRIDLEQDVDFVEEYARLHGYEQIPETLPSLKQSPTPNDKSYLVTRRASEVMKSLGLAQSFHMIFTSPEKELAFLGQTFEDAQPGSHSVYSQGSSVALLNPLSEDQSVLRRTLSCGLFETMKLHLSRGLERGGLFEIAKVFGHQNSAYREKLNLGFVVWGKDSSMWRAPKERAFYKAKSILEAFFQATSIKSFDFRPFKNQQCPSFLHPFQSAEIFFQGQAFGFLGHIHPLLADENKIREEVALVEIDFEKIISFHSKIERVSPLSKFQPVDRDLAFVISDDICIGDMIKEIKRIAGSKLRDVYVFDLFSGAPLEAGFRSVAFRMKLQDAEATLTDEVLTALQNQMIEKLQTKFNCRLR
jgi:phenylalanyl-tRNA synthetase beta chain